MGYGGWFIFEAIVPEPFAHDWQGLVTRAGYRVDRQPEEYWQRARSLGLPPNEGEPLSGIARWGDHEAQVFIEKRKREEDQSVYWSLSMPPSDGTLSKGERDLIWIFVASGVGPWGGRLGCRRIYRCQQGTAQRFLDRLDRTDPTLRHTFLDAREGGGPPITPPRFQGRIERAGLLLHFFVGPAFDPDGGTEAEYVALDYTMPWIRGRRRYKQFVTEITSRLAEQGAVEVGIR